MERKDAFPESGYPRIDPEVRKKIEAVRIEDHQKTGEYYAYYHELVWYGVEAVFHVQFARDALDVAAGKTSLEGFMAKYRLHKKEKYSNHFLASVQPVEDAGIYFPPQREGGEMVVFSDDYMNQCGFPTSTFRTPKPLNLEIMRRNWQPEDFTDGALMLKALGLAKNLWAIAAVNFEVNRKKNKKRVGLPQDAADAGRGLIDYYWQIVEAPDGHATPAGQWLVYRGLSNKELNYDRGPQVFMGRKPELAAALKQFPGAINACDPDVEILKTLRQRTRKKLAAALIAEKILEPEDDY